MIRRVVPSFLVFLLMSFVVISTSVWKVEASEAVYIRANGSVDPSGAPLSTFDYATYTLTGNIASDTHGIVVERDNIIIDGARYTVQGTGAENSIGINLTKTSNVTIKNTQIKAFCYGIYLYDSAFNTITSNNITNNRYGMELWDCLSNRIVGNNMADNDRGISIVEYTSYNTFSGNNITNNSEYGVYFHKSDDNYFYHNNFVGNTQQVYLNESGYANSWDDDYPSGGNYWSDYTGVDVDGDGIGDTQYDIDDENVDNYPWTNPWTGIIHIRADGSVEPLGAPVSTVDYVTYTLTDDISGDILSNAIIIERGDIVIDGAGHTVQGTGSPGSKGIVLSYENNVTIKNVQIKAFYYGICLHESLWNTVSRNNLEDNEYGVGIWHSSVTITGNNITSSDLCGIVFNSSFGFSTISENIIAGNSVGILVEGSSNNDFFHNTLIGNVEQAIVHESLDNVWDDGSISGGNYWSDYTGVDVDGDGIGDTQYDIDPDNTDRYPLMSPWTGIVYIKADGSVDPYTAPIQHTIGIYTLTGNIYGSIAVEMNSTVVDGSGFTVQGKGALYSIGVDLTKTSNVTIKNMQIKAFYYGMHLASSSNNVISGNNITNNEYCGILLNFSFYNSVSANNIVDNSDDGIYINSSSYNNISGNSIIDNERGIDLNLNSTHNNIAGNNITSNGRGRYGVGIYLDSSSDNIVSENSIVNNNNANIGLSSSSSNIITGNMIAGSEYGISASYSSNNNSIYANEIVENSDDGIELYLCTHSNIFGNNITGNNDYGIHVYSSSHNTVFENNITDNDCGIGFSWTPNNAAENNKFYHNNLANNTRNAIPSIFANTWDDGYPSGGNYWNDYNGTDANHDGIGDTPYVLFANNTDHYPLMNTYIIPEFSSFVALSLFAVTTLAMVLIYKRKHEERE